MPSSLFCSFEQMLGDAGSEVITGNPFLLIVRRAEQPESLRMAFLSGLFDGRRVLSNILLLGLRHSAL